MILKSYSAALRGIEPFLVEVEVDVRSGMPSYTTVGLAETAVKESRERVKSAIVNSGFSFPNEVITVNLAPAEMPKEGSQLDLSIALSLLGSTFQLPPQRLSEFIIFGELSLDGKLRGVRGLISYALFTKSLKKKMIIPEPNREEAEIVEGLEVYSFSSLKEVVLFLRGEKENLPIPNRKYDDILVEPPSEYDFSDVKGQYFVKRALEVAAAGNHNLLMIGPPGSGKSMLAKRFPTILPPMTFEEAIETTKIHSIKGDKRGVIKGLVVLRPFRAPHHTISYAGMIGGGTNANPGEVSLAHNGVLFLDELTEFRRDVLESLRQPLEDRKVSIARAKETITYPANFMLLAATNPCPCGFYGDLRRNCRCTPLQIRKYLSKISGPLMDRIDIQIEVPSLSPEELQNKEKGDSSKIIRERVMKAREIQRIRFREYNITSNSEMNESLVEIFCKLNEETRQFLLKALEISKLSARGHNRVLKVARTIADLDNSDEIKIEHLAEAIQYRSLDKKFFD